MNSKILSIVGALSLTAFSAAQACEISARVSVVGNEFPAKFSNSQLETLRAT